MMIIAIADSFSAINPFYCAAFVCALHVGFGMAAVSLKFQSYAFFILMDFDGFFFHFVSRARFKI